MYYLLIKTTLHQERQAEDGIRDHGTSRGLGDVYKRQIGSLASVPPEIDPTDVLETSQSFLCKACGTELTVKLQSVVANEPPKHCKEEMTPIEN